MKIIPTVIQVIMKWFKRSTKAQVFTKITFYGGKEFRKQQPENTLKQLKDLIRFKNLFLAKFYLIKPWLNFWGVTDCGGFHG